LSEDAEAVAEASYTINQCLWTAAKVESPLVGWDNVEGFRFPSFARQHLRRADGSRLLETSFQVVGGWAFLWRTTERDVAIFIEPGAEWGALGELQVKRGTRRSPRFLVEEVSLA